MRQIDKVRGEVQSGDRFLLCSDGLTKYASQADLEFILRTTPMETTGKVYMIGAGPGDPGLLTRRGAECLARAPEDLASKLYIERCQKLGAEGVPPGWRGETVMAGE